MEKEEAKEHFREATEWFNAGEYERALDELEVLERDYPDNHRVLNAKARTLHRLQRYGEALTLCDRLLNEFEYEKVRPLQEKILTELDALDAQEGEDTRRISLPEGDGFRTAMDPDEESMWEVHDEGDDGASGEDGFVESLEVDDDDEEESESFLSRLWIGPIWLVVFAGLGVAMYMGWLSYYIGGGIIAAYFIIRILTGAAIQALFSIPFKMKGKALAGATVEVHGHTWTARPKSLDEDGDLDGPEAKNMRYVWVDCTITPQPRSEGFTHWEAGELVLAPGKVKKVKLNMLDDCYEIPELRYIMDGKELEYEGEKFPGPMRVKLLCAVPNHETQFRLVYYFEVFGEINLST